VSKNRVVDPIGQRLVPIAVALIGLIGFITPVIINSLSTQPPNDPVVDIQFDDAKDQAVEITLTNKGFAPATDVTLSVDASGKIANSSNYTLNTVQVYPVKIDDRRLEAKIPELVQGSGSIVKLMISLSESLNSSHYVAYLTYDQGSNMEEYPTDFSSPDFSGSVNEFLSMYGDYYATFSIVFSLSVSLIAFLYGSRKRKKGDKKNSFHI
jgi:hypothetical protein